MLERDGLGGLTLRAVAREAGVSHAAPTHHFGDLTGLVSELAAIGFRQFNAAMAAAGAIDAPPLLKAMARAKAYVAYAQAHPGMYGLMFRTERLDMTRPSLHEAASASFAGLAGAVGVSRQQQMSDEALSLEHAAAIARAWSLVHGFTTLLLDGRLNDILKRLPKGNNVETLLDAMLRSTVVRPPGPVIGPGPVFGLTPVLQTGARPLSPMHSSSSASLPQLKACARVSSAALRASFIGIRDWPSRRS